MATDYFALAVAQARQQFTPDRIEPRAVPSHDSIYQAAIRLYWASREEKEKDRTDKAEGGR